MVTKRSTERGPRYDYQRAWNEANDAKLKARRNARIAEFRKFLNTYKLERGCVDCGYKAHPAALDLDHRDPSEKVNSVAKMWAYTKEHLTIELEKCDVRCANCHRIKTFNSKEGGKGRPTNKQLGR